MPNWVRNVVTLKGNAESVKKVVEFVKSENSVFDFDKIVPQPESIKKYDTTNYPYGEKLVVGEPLDRFEKDSPIVTEELIEEYKVASKEQMNKYGVIGWYDWNRKYWGTKWNACEAYFNASDDTFNFDTAWSAPLEVLEALGKLFPEVEFEFMYADEDSGCNTGKGFVRNGQLYTNFPDNMSDEAMAIYFDLWGDDDYWVKNPETGEWEYRDEDYYNEENES